MAVTLLRSIYINSLAAIIPEVPNFGGANGILARIPTNGQKFNVTQSANFALNIPRSDVNAFGYDGVLDRPQLEAETATMEVAHVAQTALSGEKNNDINGDMYMDLIDQSKAQLPAYIQVEADGVGAIGAALMNSLSGEVSVGALATFTAGFTGATRDVGNIQAVFLPITDAAGGPVYTPPEVAGVDGAGAGATSLGAYGGAFFKAGGGILVNPKDITLTASNLSPDSNTATVKLVDESAETAVAAGDADFVNESCAQSASFSWDMPVEIILCLGSDPATDGLALGNPPGSSSITVEALSAQLSEVVLAQNYNLNVGAYNIGLMAANIDSRTHNLAVGDLYGTYNYVLGSTGDSFEIGVN